ncbi:ankyrin repeat protein (macronuclear) [Tetrahymena thermophila SB210]|uniref:Palmitoyltransferase n=1 Tax=Tetrahymena thermophila (strain SB210) TaxID=312017 RepID=Q22BC3_TETTS|nr:ankyrin repeat protein [Tetrahymena thermophila SB210]EAR82585.3 ankyrin repeat protein [Tetrahymena thermophila SB210]|eukprot:XP_001030248.3 ankyrin repeat protein [Tetrahymena thermophila SB210]
MEDSQNTKEELSQQLVIKFISLTQKENFEKAINILRENPDLPILDTVDKKYNNALHYVCLHNSIETFDVVMSYLEYIVKCNNQSNELITQFLVSKNEDDYSPFHLSVYKGNLEMIEKMMQYNIDISIRARKGLSVLHLAAQGNHPHILHYFLQKGINIDLKNQHGGTALHYAAFSKSAESVMYLISKGSDINLQDNQGATPLFLAAIQLDNTYIANKLLKKGADPRIKNKDGKDAIQAAQEKKNTDMVKLLKKKNGLVELMNIKSAQKPVKCKLLPLILNMVLFLIVSIATFVFNIPYFTNGFWILLLTFLLFISFISFLLSWLIEPGYIRTTDKKKDLEYQLKCLQQSNDDHEICYECILLRPPRSKHCEYCQRCVIVYDHHCPWINNCVGANNYLWFSIFIFSTFFYALFIIVTSSMYMMESNYGNYGLKFNNQNTQLILHKLSSIICIVIGIFTCLMLSVLIKVQISNMATGKTTHERFNGVYQKKTHQKFQNRELTIQQQSSNEQSSTEDDTLSNELMQNQQNDSDLESQHNFRKKKKNTHFSCFQGIIQLCFTNKNNSEYRNFQF